METVTYLIGLNDGADIETPDMLGVSIYETTTNPSRNNPRMQKLQ